MAYFAKLNNENEVIDVVSASDAINGEAYFLQLTGYVHKQTSFNTKQGVHYDPQTQEPSADQSKAMRKNYASIGFKYHADIDAFVPPRSYDSWVLNPDKGDWEPPVAMPSDGKPYQWDEDSGSWVEGTAPAPEG